MPVQGLVRLRKHQFARQAAFGSKLPATKAYPFKGVPDVDLTWTDPEIDAGSRDIVAPPSRGAPVLAASLTDPMLAYNSLPLLMCGFFGGAVTPAISGAARTWTHEPASVTVDDPDVFTYEFGDDVLTDWYQLGDGILTAVEVSGPEGLGPLTTSMTWKFGSVGSSGSSDNPDVPAVPTGALNVDTEAAIVYLKDLAIYIADSIAGLAAAQVSDALHSFTLRFGQEVDEKRWANGDQSFDVDDYGPGARTIDLECTFAKTADTVGIGSESDKWMSDEAVNRFVELKCTSTKMADGATPYSWDVVMPMRYYTRTEGEVGQNTVAVLTGHAFYDPDDLEGVFTSEIVCTLTEDELGSVGS